MKECVPGSVWACAWILPVAQLTAGCAAGRPRLRPTLLVGSARPWTSEQVTDIRLPTPHLVDPRALRPSHVSLMPGICRVAFGH
jgi:hypothetical protein